MTSEDSTAENRRDDMLNVELILGAGGPRPVRLNVTSARVVDRENGTMEISMSQDDIEEYHAELRLDEVDDGR